MTPPDLRLKVDQNIEISKISTISKILNPRSVCLSSSKQARQPVRLSVCLQAILPVCPVSTRLCICPSVCLSVYVYVWAFSHLSICPFVTLFIHPCLSVRLSVYVYVVFCMSVCISVCMSVCLSVCCLPICLYVHLYIFPFVHLSTCQPSCLSFCPSVFL